MEASIIAQTKHWLKEIVIRLNFCPFANPVFKNDTIRYVVVPKSTFDTIDKLFLNECKYLTDHPETATTLIIFESNFASFSAYWTYIQKINTLLDKKKLRGIYQVATFHPDYVFGSNAGDDVANYTNRSPYPMIHIIRESSISDALKKYPNPHIIPENNIKVATEKGLDYFIEFLNSCQQL